MASGFMWQWEPLQTRPSGLRSRKRSTFKASWSNTLALLEEEIIKLGARAAVIQADVERSDLRLDGMLRAGAKVKSPAVAISFEAKGKPYCFPCDRFDDWQDNIRAVALGLHALRAVDRYGITQKGEQYTGWQALPAPPSNGFRGESAAREFLAALLGVRPDYVLANAVAAIREAELKTHPDRGGDADQFKRVQQARAVLLR